MRLQDDLIRKNNVNEDEGRLIDIIEQFHPKPEAMSREEFKRRWDAREPITYDEVADCYVAWGLGSYPRTKPIDLVMDRVLKAADCEWDEE